MPDHNSLPKRVVDMMMNKDYFSQWLGIEVLVADPGKSVLKMKIRKEMLNGFGIAHGGISFSFADSALAFASNSHGQKSVSIETSISHTKSLMEGDEIIATATELSRSNKIAIYSIAITNQQNEIVGLFKGTVYRTSKLWFPEEA
ncbi:MAG: hotdog fold thioesterase [Bacteroidia bacterium]